jgi:hypothetical protein
MMTAPTKKLEEARPVGMITFWYHHIGTPEKETVR